MSEKRWFIDALEEGGWFADSEVWESVQAPESICRLLNYRGPTDTAAALKRAEEVHRQQPEKSFESILNDLQALFVVFHWLRKYLDEWIDSGRKDGVDSPWERTIPSDAVDVFSGAFRASLRVRADGRPAVGYELSDLGVHRLEKFGYKVHGQLEATLRFMLLMDSPDRERVSRCDVCRKIFEHQRRPKKGIVIKHGSFCDSCQGKGRVQGTVRSRERRKNELVALAATFWEQCPQAKQHKRSEWVAVQMNRKLKLRKGAHPVTKKWVTQNQVAIEAAVLSLRSHASSATERGT
jgi:hypothetical protein